VIALLTAAAKAGKFKIDVVAYYRRHPTRSSTFMRAISTGMHKARTKPATEDATKANRTKKLTTVIANRRYAKV
jgi:hypothetical protein